MNLKFCPPSSSSFPYSFGNLNIPEDTEDEKKSQQEVRIQLDRWRAQAVPGPLPKTYTCPVCAVVVKKGPGLRTHLMSHITQSLFVCKIGDYNQAFNFEQYR